MIFQKLKVKNIIYFHIFIKNLIKKKIKKILSIYLVILKIKN